MAGNTFGKLFKLTTFGESHGEAIGGIIDGCPAGVELDFEAIQTELDRRKPGQSKITTQRKESDTVQFLSGIFEGKTTGTPIGFIIPNSDARSKDYDHLKDVYRPSHADYTYDKKYGHRDYRGGGRSSARETATRVVAGAIAMQVLASQKISINAYVSQVGSDQCEKHYSKLDFDNTFSNIVRCPDDETATRFIKQIEQIRNEGDTVGGVVTCVIENTPVGLGDPVFDKLHADLGKAMLSINAVKGFEYGSGFGAVKMRGSEHNDIFENNEGEIKTKSNNSGGIQGGISNGEDIYFNVAFKPVATLMSNQQSVDKRGDSAEVEGKGRHDPCVVPRAVPIVRSMAAIVILDAFLMTKTTQV
jgi:chorismate synthase